MYGCVPLVAQRQALGAVGRRSYRLVETTALDQRRPAAAIRDGDGVAIRGLAGAHGSRCPEMIDNAMARHKRATTC